MLQEARPVSPSSSRSSLEHADSGDFSRFIKVNPTTSAGLKKRAHTSFKRGSFSSRSLFLKRNHPQKASSVSLAADNYN